MTLLFKQLDAFTCGQLLAMYEHRVFVQVTPPHPHTLVLLLKPGTSTTWLLLLTSQLWLAPWLIGVTFLETPPSFSVAAALKQDPPRCPDSAVPVCAGRHLGHQLVRPVGGGARQDPRQGGTTITTHSASSDTQNTHPQPHSASTDLQTHIVGGRSNAPLQSGPLGVTRQKRTVSTILHPLHHTSAHVPLLFPTLTHNVLLCMCLFSGAHAAGQFSQGGGGGGQRLQLVDRQPPLLLPPAVLLDTHSPTRATGWTRGLEKGGAEREREGDA